MKQRIITGERTLEVALGEIGKNSEPLESGLKNQITEPATDARPNL